MEVGPGLHLHIDTERCTGCGRCVAACNERNFTLETVEWRKHAQLREGNICTTCGKCIEECPVKAITEY